LTDLINLRRKTGRRPTMPDHAVSLAYIADSRFDYIEFPWR